MTDSGRITRTPVFRRTRPGNRRRVEGAVYEIISTFSSDGRYFRVNEFGLMSVSKWLQASNPVASNPVERGEGRDLTFLVLLLNPVMSTGKTVLAPIFAVYLTKTSLSKMRRTVYKNRGSSWSWPRVELK